MKKCIKHKWVYGEDQEANASVKKCNWMDTTLALSFRCTSQMDSYVSLPMIGWIVGLGKLSRIFSVDGIVLLFT